MKPQITAIYDALHYEYDPLQKSCGMKPQITNSPAAVVQHLTGFKRAAA